MSDESARASLQEALDALDRGETVEVSPTAHDVTTMRLADLATALRDEFRPDVNVTWVDTGALTYTLGPALSH